VGGNAIGIDINGARFLVFAKTIGVDFTKMAMIGRQRLYVTQSEMRKLSVSCGLQLSEAKVAEICDGSGSYTERFFNFVGAKTVHSIDYSDYENPTHTHDMNDPIPNDLSDAYTAVLDGGSLEHVFNFPVAIKNCMEMVKVGGHYLAITPANNFFGHGFYQFSPELYFTVFSAENGFEITKIIAFEECATPVWYVVKSPRSVAERVTLSNSLPVYLLVVAKKVACVPIFARAPQQSDYVALWGESRFEPTDCNGKFVTRPLAIRVARKILPAGIRRFIRGGLERPRQKLEGFDARYFERIDWPTNTDAWRN
jgi:hypothetical protein